MKGVTGLVLAVSQYAADDLTYQATDTGQTSVMYDSYTFCAPRPVRVTHLRVAVTGLYAAEDRHTACHLIRHSEPIATSPLLYPGTAEFDLDFVVGTKQFTCAVVDLVCDRDDEPVAEDEYYHAMLVSVRHVKAQHARRWRNESVEVLFFSEDRQLQTTLTGPMVVYK